MAEQMLDAEVILTRGLETKFDSPILYHSVDFLRNQPGPPACTFLFCLAGQIKGGVHFDLQGSRAISQVYAPFGSISGTGNGESDGCYLVERTEQLLAEQGIKEIIFRHYAPIYNPDDPWISVFKQLQYQRVDQQNHHLIISDKSFAESLHPMHSRKLKKSGELEFSWYTPTQFNEVYNFIAKCRAQKKRQLSMGLSELLPVVKAMPQSFLMPVVKFQGTMIAAAVVVQVTSKVWYNFYPAHDHEFDNISPMVFLLSEMYRKAQTLNIEYIDLGTSEFKGMAIPTLARFKQRVGGIETLKPTFRKLL